jgi:hypothetical protein
MGATVVRRWRFECRIMQGVMGHVYSPLEWCIVTMFGEKEPPQVDSA